MRVQDPNQITLQDRKGTTVALKLDGNGTLDIEGDEAIAKVQITANLRPDSGELGKDAQKANMLLGVQIGTAPSDDSVLGELKRRLTERFGSRVKVDLMDESPTVRDLRAQKGEVVYEATLYPIPNGTRATTFVNAVRQELNGIREEMAPKPAKPVVGLN
jgi:hypothetical protein